MEACFWYANFDMLFSKAGCLNKLPLPFKNPQDSANYGVQHQVILELEMDSHPFVFCAKSRLHWSHVGYLATYLPHLTTMDYHPPTYFKPSSFVQIRLNDWLTGTYFDFQALDLLVEGMLSYLDRNIVCLPGSKDQRE